MTGALLVYGKVNLNETTLDNTWRAVGLIDSKSLEIGADSTCENRRTMPVLETLEGGQVPVKVWTMEIEASARQQLANLTKLPIIHHHVAAMPDVHTGIGATVGSVIATYKAIIPAAVGVNIGCGIIAARTSLTADNLDEKSLRKVFGQIHRDVPVGRAQHKEDRTRAEAAQLFAPGLKRITYKHPEILKAFSQFSNWIYQLGTLGTGNHFIECVWMKRIASG